MNSEDKKNTHLPLFQAEPQSQAKGQTILSIVHAMEKGKEYREEVMAKHGLKNIQAEKWYSLQSYLNAFKELYERLGPNTIYMIGKKIPESAKFPPEIDSLKKALESIDSAYKLNHRGGNFGFYKLESFDEKAKKATLLCENPYPSELDRGIIMTMVSRFRPTGSFKYDVQQDTSKKSRLKGDESCTFLITW